MPLPYWSARSSIRSLPTLARDLHVDVVVLGGGVTGLTTALLLLMSGHRVAVLERDRCAGGDTGHTSAHLTMVTDERLSDLSKSLGATHAQAVWDAGLAGINQIDVLASTHRIDCGFEWVPGFLYARPGTDTDAALDLLREEADAAADLGFDAELVPSVPLMQTPGVRYDNQARLRPRKYVAGLVDAIVRLGGHVFERSAPEHFSAAPLRMKVNGHTVTCDELVVATHNPTMGVASVASAAMLQSTLALYTSYVIAATVAKGRAPDALLWDTETPYRYFRVDPQPDHDVVIFGGEDHKTGQTDDPDACYARLEHALQTLLPGADVTHRWSGQIIHTPDGLPFIGRVADHQFMATGFNGNGLTFGTVGAMIISDAIAGQTNPWVELFAPGRGAIRRGVWDYLKENADYAYYMVRDRFAGASSRSLRAVRRGEGRIIEQHGKKVAAYRDARGVITLRSPVCTHLGCLVVWNTAENTWDCPCHGSRFKPNGDVIAGPAESPLAAITE